jgi:hypothetical protein
MHFTKCSHWPCVGETTSGSLALWVGGQRLLIMSHNNSFSATDPIMFTCGHLWHTDPVRGLLLRILSTKNESISAYVGIELCLGVATCGSLEPCVVLASTLYVTYLVSVFLMFTLTFLVVASSGYLATCPMWAAFIFSNSFLIMLTWTFFLWVATCGPLAVCVGCYWPQCFFYDVHMTFLGVATCGPLALCVGYFCPQCYFFYWRFTWPL